MPAWRKDDVGIRRIQVGDLEDAMGAEAREGCRAEARSAAQELAKAKPGKDALHVRLGKINMTPPINGVRLGH